MTNYLEYMGVDEGNQMWVEWFKSHDTNNDGVITVDEAAKQ
ncbi:hypothetical protein JI435_141510 [Parastagonospora nodorum SN15]|uniref:EF-hand domain-containing protein n=1 Tax=Phaeosphaeria nodorum (strain SN15 / ATCC MYA-4574 / FGSC 10173) TaxID=321614 RepID=A0A7U2FD36_PHANO|nr:hypothetical protein JI435_141510 [Parastagonospora nodorum SN15]